jgi:formiminotetrahydrofolate cyclodeaminase
MLTNLTVQDFLNETASNSPAPGGGSVSALAAALGAALISMVCRLTIGKKKYADVQEAMEETLRNSEALRLQFVSLIEEDTIAFNGVMAAMSLPKESAEQISKRAEVIQEATKAATLVPAKLMELCTAALLLANTAAEKGNKNSFSDAQVAVLMLKAGFEGARHNVEINLGGIQDTVFIAEIKRKTEVLQKMANL